MRKQNYNKEMARGGDIQSKVGRDREGRREGRESDRRELDGGERK